ncbi:hypothetical protein A6C57_03015 [Fibrella sp. ES10-3-2-2]|nr:hypothetical protein A6C57_03015 [Fibrella sp. ES10-3-2-2]
MSFYLLFYGLLVFFYDFLALIGHTSLLGISQFRRIQQQIGDRQAHWVLRLLALLLVTAGLSVRYRYHLP